MVDRLSGSHGRHEVKRGGTDSEPPGLVQLSEGLVQFLIPRSACDVVPHHAANSMSFHRRDFVEHILNNDAANRREGVLL